MPDVIDLEALRGRGRQAGEAPMPDDDAASSSSSSSSISSSAIAPTKQVEADEVIVATLASLGFPAARCAKAAVRTANAGVDEAS